MKNFVVLDIEKTKDSMLLENPQKNKVRRQSKSQRIYIEHSSGILHFEQILLSLDSTTKYD